MKNVVFYARVSTLELEQMSALKEQVTSLEKFIDEKENWILVDKYIDKGKSGTATKNRREYNRLYNDLLNKKFDIVVIKDESRLNRNVLEWYKFIDRMLKNNKQLYFYMEKKFYTPDDAFLVGIKALMANEYSRDLSKKLNEAHMRRKKKGKPLINNRIWGYNLLPNGKIIINEEEAEIVRYIFGSYINNKGFRTIYKELEEKGIRNRNGKPFAMTTLKRIIRNEKYKGTIVANKTHKDFDTKKVYNLPKEQWIVHEDAIPAIISKVEWEKANEILRTKKRKNPNADKEDIIGYFKGTQTYSGKIICGECGRKYWHSNYRNISHWMCSEYKSFGVKREGKAHGCVNFRFNTEIIDSIMKEVIYEFWINRNDYTNNVLNVLNKVINSSDNENCNLDNLENELSKLENKKNKLIDFLTEDLITKNEYIVQKQKIDNKIIDLNNQLENEKNNIFILEDKKERLNKIQSFLDKQITNKEMINDNIITSLLDRIVITSKNEMDIYLSIGIKESIKLDSDENGCLCVSIIR